MSSSAHLEREASEARVGLSSALDDLRESVSTTALKNGAMTFAKEGSAAVAKAAVDRAIANPLAAMLIGAGVVMLISGSNRNSTVGSAVYKGNSALKSAANTLAGAGSSIAGAASNALSAVSGAVAGTAAAVADTAAATADRVKTTAADASEMATGAYDTASSMASGAYDKARSTVDQGRNAIQQTGAMMSDTQSRLERFAREQPILMAALGVAVGAAVGASLPMTRAEQEYMGATARKAGELGSDMAKKVADTVTEKVAGGDIKAKVGEVAEAITNSVAGGDTKGKADQPTDLGKPAFTTRVAPQT